jgi:hypothetical protein
MSVDNPNIIDLVGIDQDGNVVLTISDHLEWDDNNEHLLVLQEKINAYIGSIESGDLIENYPDAKNRNILIRIELKYSPDKDGAEFLERVKEILGPAGFNFQYEKLDVENS